MDGICDIMDCDSRFDRVKECGDGCIKECEEEFVALIECDVVQHNAEGAECGCFPEEAELSSIESFALNLASVLATRKKVRV